MNRNAVLLQRSKNSILNPTTLAKRPRLLSATSSPSLSSYTSTPHLDPAASSRVEVIIRNRNRIRLSPPVRRQLSGIERTPGAVIRCSHSRSAMRRLCTGLQGYGQFPRLGGHATRFDPVCLDLSRLPCPAGLPQRLRKVRHRGGR